MKIAIKPVAVALGVNADQVEFQILTFTLEPTEGIQGNAKFFDGDIEVSNKCFDISQEIYSKWGSKDSYMTNACLAILNLEKA